MPSRRPRGGSAIIIPTWRVRQVRWVRSSLLGHSKELKQRDRLAFAAVTGDFQVSVVYSMKVHFLFTGCVRCRLAVALVPTALSWSQVPGGQSDPYLECCSFMAEQETHQAPAVTLKDCSRNDTHPFH